MRSKMYRCFLAVLLAIAASALICAAEDVKVVQPVPGTAHWVLDPVNTTVIFTMNHSSLLDLYGYFPGSAIHGGGDIDDKDFTQSKFSVKIDAAALKTVFDFPDIFTGSEGGIDAKKFPTIAFDSTKIEKNGKKFRMTGNLTLHGVTKQVVLDLDPSSQIELFDGIKYRAFQATGVIKRQDFDVNWVEPEHLSYPLFSNEIRLTIIIEVINPPKPEQTGGQALPGTANAQGSGKQPPAGNANPPAAPLYDNSAEADAIRQKNFKTALEFLKLDGEGGDSSKLFVPGGIVEQTFPFYGDSPTRMTQGGESQQPPPSGGNGSTLQEGASGGQPPQQGEAGGGAMPLELTIDWVFYDQTVHFTDDPNYLIIENYGHGKQLASNGEYVAYQNHYIHTFKMDDGLIKEYREITNPLNLYKAFGLQLPHMPTPDETEKAAIAARAPKKATDK